MTFEPNDDPLSGADTWEAPSEPTEVAESNIPATVELAGEGYDDQDWEVLPTVKYPAPLIIPGGATLKYSRVVAPRRRHVSAQLFMMVVTVCVVASALFSVGAAEAFSGGATANPFTVLAHLIEQPQTLYFSYTAQPGDTFDSVAARFHVQVNGIFELNGLTLDADIIVGHVYYVIPFPPGENAYSIRTPEISILSTDGFQFSAVGGKTNGPNGVCPQGYAAWGGNPALYNLINPDQPPTGKPPYSYFTQRFSWHHDAIDISTGSNGTPLYAAQAGTVIYAAWDDGGGGYTVKISHCGYVSTSYSHMVAGSFLVHVGQNVAQGQEIGLQGMTGDATGPHVHFMLWWENIPVDPVCAYPNGIDGVTLSSEGGAYNGCPPNLNHDAWP
jgi:murein DD-endopeptidase MepM/ murein hydrolase activator NlpD